MGDHEEKKESSGKGEGGPEPMKKPQMDMTSIAVAVVLGGMLTMYLMPDLTDEITTTEFINSYVASRQVLGIITGYIVAGKNNGGYKYGGISEKPPNLTRHVIKRTKVVIMCC